MSGNAAGTIAKVGIPLALTAVTGGLGAPAALADAAGLSAIQAGALTGAATGALGSAITGGNPLTGAALGGIGGGIGQTQFAKDLMNGADVAPQAAGETPPTGIGGYNGDEALSPDLVKAHPELNTDVVARNPASTPSGGIGGFVRSNALPIAGGLAVLATSPNNGKQTTQLQGDQRQPNDVQPLQRTQTPIDPSAYYGVGGQRQAFDVVNPSVVTTPQHFAGGGSALFQKAKGPSSFKQGQFRPAKLAAGGRPGIPQMPHPAIGSMVQGAGDGQSDQIPAMLSDGEYVIPAPVVSALGRGSNNAGAKKLDKLKHHVMKKTYKGAKPPAARMGLGSMGMA